MTSPLQQPRQPQESPGFFRPVILRRRQGQGTALASASPPLASSAGHCLPRQCLPWPCLPAVLLAILGLLCLPQPGSALTSEGGVGSLAAGDVSGNGGALRGTSSGQTGPVREATAWQETRWQEQQQQQRQQQQQEQQEQQGEEGEGEGGGGVGDSEAASEVGRVRRCSNTLQGRVMVSDDRGYTCRRWDLDFRTGCCRTSNASMPLPQGGGLTQGGGHLRASSKALLVFPRSQALPMAASMGGDSGAGAGSGSVGGDRFSCASCDLAKQCCAEYEYCVSCCLQPGRTPASAVLALPRAQQASAVPFKSVFEFCSMRCRHNSRSVVHENAYVSPLHHCYALPRAAGHSPSGEPRADELGRSVTVAVAARGVSCDDACSKADLKCDDSYLPLLNNCTVMRQHLPCQAGCLRSSGPDQPAEVVGSAPLRQQPGACVVNANKALFSCSGYHENTRRLCPCTAWAGA